ncbi:DUF4352 domain-containing protein [Streptosporangium sp. V21-05]|uniref:DUF4352 domain-containing protein n=1 Tax=Streptosporangium sp. V21-05 TaxID=3446115 RepID=UPI003F53C6ED
MAVIALATVALLGIAVAATLIVLSPTSPNTGAPDSVEVAAADLPAQEQNEAGARAAAQQIFDLYAAGSYGKFWDHWAPQSQALVSRDDYVDMFEQCPQIARNLRFTITSVTVNGDAAQVQANRLIAAFTFDFLYEGQAWRYVLPADQQKEYQSKTVEQIVQERRTSRLCGGQDAPQLTPQPAPTSTPPPAAQEQAPSGAKVGETLTVKGLQSGVEVAVTLNRVIDNATPNNPYVKPKAGSRYIAIELTLKNIGQDVYTDSPGIGGALIDAEGQQHRPTFAEVTEGIVFGGAVTVNRGDARKGLIVFEMPAAAKAVKLQFGVMFGQQKGEWVLS